MSSNVDAKLTVISQPKGPQLGFDFTTHELCTYGRKEDLEALTFSKNVLYVQRKGPQLSFSDH